METRRNHSRAGSLGSQTARSVGAAGWSSSADQRPIAAASSRPISPPPTMPMRTGRAVAATAQATAASRSSACSGVSPSCTTAISACVMAVGSGCWMTLRP